MQSWKEKCLSQNYLTEKEAEQIFGNIHVLLNLNRQLLVDLLNCHKTWHPKTSKIAPVFIDFARYFMLYKDYCNNTG